MFSKLALVAAAVAAFVVAWMGSQSAVTSAVESQAISPGEIVINQASTAGEDWITIYNKLDRPVELEDFMFTDGDSQYEFPFGATIPPHGEIRLAAEKDREKLAGRVDFYWEGWGLSDEGELLMLINNEGNMVVDFVFAPPMEKGEKIERTPRGLGPMLGPDKQKLTQLEPPTYTAVPNTVVEDISQKFSASVVSFGGLLTAVSTVLLNLDQTKSIVDKYRKGPRRTEDE
jgi:hypothetical protein